MTVSTPAPPTLRPLPGLTHRMIESGDVRLHVAAAGSGPPFVLLHGWPQHWWCWRHLIPRLAERYRVLVPDLRGFGWSDAPSQNLRVATIPGAGHFLPEEAPDGVLDLALPFLEGR